MQPRFDAKTAISTMVTESATLVFDVPTMFVQLLQAVGGLGANDRLPELRQCISGGARSARSGYGAIRADLCHHRLRRVSTVGDLADRDCEPAPPRDPHGTVGHPLWGVEVEIADDTVEDRVRQVLDGELGEIVIRGHGVFAGYHGEPAAMAEVLIDGWFRTGDIERKDMDGSISVGDRKNDLIIRSGFNVYPREVEDVWARHHTVGQVAVLGIPEPEKGEEVCAVVVPAEGQRVDSDALMSWAKTAPGEPQVSAPGSVGRQTAARAQPQGAETGTVSGSPTRRTDLGRRDAK